MPGTHSQKRTLLNCVGCHTLERVMRSTHDSAGFLQALQRMAGYANQSTPLRPQRRLADRDRELIGEERARFQREQAEWLSAINLSSGPSWQFPLQTLPRPSGRGTRVIITEYDLPRPTIEPHDVVVDADGIAWYSDFGDQSIGKLDPKSGKVTEHPVPELKKGWPTGLLSLRFDREQNLWAGMMYQGAIAKLDRKSGKLQLWSIPPELNKANTQINMTSPLHFAVDGKMWTQNNGFAAVHRIDLASGKWETFEPFKDSKRNHNIYDVIADSKNNVYFTDFANEHIGRIDAKSGNITLYATPTPGSSPRRGMMDAQDRLWFAEYRGNRIGLFDPGTERFQEWEAPRAWSAPYDIALDRNGEAWTGSMLSDRILRLDPKSGRFVEYLLPRPTNIRRVFVDHSATPVAFWVGSNHGASIIKPFRNAGRVLGRQQPRRVDHQTRAARLSTPRQTQEPRRQLSRLSDPRSAAPSLPRAPRYRDRSTRRCRARIRLPAACRRARTRCRRPTACLPRPRPASETGRTPRRRPASRSRRAAR